MQRAACQTQPGMPVLPWRPELPTRQGDLTLTAQDRTEGLYLIVFMRIHS